MEDLNNQINETKKSVVKKKQVLKKLDPETSRLLQAIKDKINKKAFGRKIKDYEIIAKGISLISADDIQELQERTYSEKDRLGLAHDSYQKLNGKIGLDVFIGKLLRGELNLKSNPAVHKKT